MPGGFCVGKKKLWLGMLGIVLVFGIMLSSCNVEPDESATATPDEPVTAIFWPKDFSFSTDNSRWGTLQDGYLRRQEITETSFDWERANNFQNSPQYVWTEEQIYIYILGMGFGNNTAREVSAWFFSVSHGLIGVRKGSALHLILK
jgi:hypothetical protein